MQFVTVDQTYENPRKGFCERLAARSSTGEILNVLIKGPTGCGKTTFAEQFAAEHGRPFVAIEGGNVVEADSLTGHWEVKPSVNGSVTIFTPSRLIEAIQNPDSVVLLDEINRFNAVKAQNVLMSLLDHQRAIYIPEMQKTIRVAPGVVFFATINEGMEYNATEALDFALQSRFSRTIELDWLPEETEILVLQAKTNAHSELAAELVRIAIALRASAPISLRQMVAAVQEVQDGARFKEALDLTFSLVEADTLLGVATAASMSYQLDSSLEEIIERAGQS